jgi:hypothetical protein
MSQKVITVVFYKRRHPRSDWRIDFDEEALCTFFDRIVDEFTPLGIRVECLKDDALCFDINGYGDLLNSIRIRSPRDGIGNLCLGHIIGASPNREPLEDIRRGISRVAFAPETIEPEGSDKIVCHNCGCGC